MMTVDDNSVNIKPAARNYHHGDLRLAVIETGMRLLENSNAESLSLREIARQTGVSATAIYRHFPDKAALLTALAIEGFERLGRDQAKAMHTAGPGIAGFNASGRAYVRFALAHPTLFRMIMAMAPTNPELHDNLTTPMQMLQANVAGLAPPGATQAELRIAVLRAWSSVHGLTMLMLDGQISIDDGLIDAVIDTPGTKSA